MLGMNIILFCRISQICCAVYPELHTKHLYMRQITKWSLWQNLLVLNIFGNHFFYMSLETAIGDVANNLKNLQVLILSTRRYSVELVSDIVKTFVCSKVS